MTKKISLFVFTLGLGFASSTFASAMYYCAKSCNSAYLYCKNHQGENCDYDHSVCLSECDKAANSK